MKRKGIILLSSIFACVALVASGFAAFVISITKEEVVYGNVEVDSVSNESFVVTKVTDPNNICYCADPKYNTEGAWLVYVKDDDNQTEVLSTSFEVSCTNSNLLNQSNPFEITVAEADDSTAYSEALTAKIVNTLPTTGSAVKKPETTDNWIITVNFSWGEAFDYKNPIEYYASKDYSYSSEADSILNSPAYKNLSNAKFVITVKPTGKSS